VNSGDWHLGLRPCAEALLTALLDRQPEPCLATIVELVGQASSEPVPSPGGGAIARNKALRVVLNKDACYHAVGLAAAYLPEGALPFPQWFVGTLMPEVQAALQINRQCGAILQRRLILLLGSFASSLTPELRATAYQSLAQIMAAEGSDVVVMLGAVDTSMLLLCDGEFDADAFAPHASTLFEGLFRLFGELTEGATLLTAIDLLTTMLGMLGAHAAEVAVAVAAQVPSLWDQATTESNAVKAAIIQAVTTLVNASPQACAALGHVAVPMIRFSINTANAEEVVFGEDGLALWRAAITSLPEVPALMALFPELCGLMRQDSSSLEDTAFICKTYVQLGREALLREHGSALAGVLDGMLGSLGDRGALLLVEVFVTVVREFPLEGPRLLARPLARMFQEIQPTGTESSVVCGAYAGVLARVWLTNPVFHQEFLQGLGGDAAHHTMVQALVTRATKSDGLSVRRVVACAAAAVASTSAGGEASLSLLPAILTFAATVATEADRGGDASNLGGDYWIAQGEPDEDAGYSLDAGFHKEQREREEGADAVNRLDVRVEVTRRLEEAAAAHGPEKVKLALAAADPQALAELRRHAPPG